MLKQSLVRLVSVILVICLKIGDPPTVLVTSPSGPTFMNKNLANLHASDINQIHGHYILSQWNGLSVVAAREQA